MLGAPSRSEREAPRTDHAAPPMHAPRWGPKAAYRSQFHQSACAVADAPPSPELAAATSASCACAGCRAHTSSLAQ